jgi:WD40 repeat protein
VAGSLPGRRTILHPDPICAVVCSPDGRQMLTGCMDGAAHLWELETGKLLGSFRAYPDDPEEVRRPKNDRGRPSASPTDYPHRVRAVAFLPDGRALLTGCGDGTVRFWDAATQKVIGTLPRQDREVSTLAVSEGRILTGCHDGTAQLWDATTRLPIGPSVACEVDRGGSHCSGRPPLHRPEDGTAQLWDAATGIRGPSRVTRAGERRGVQSGRPSRSRPAGTERPRPGTLPRAPGSSPASTRRSYWPLPSVPTADCC